MVLDSDKWRAVLRWAVPAFGITFLGLFVGQLTNLYGLAVVAYFGVAFLLAVLALFLIYLRARIGDLETRIRPLERGATRGDAESVKPLTDEERDTLRQHLEELLEQIPELRTIKDPPRFRLWRRQCLAFLERAYGGYTSQVEDFEEIDFDYTLAALDEAGAILTVAIEIHLA